MWDEQTREARALSQWNVGRLGEQFFKMNVKKVCSNCYCSTDSTVFVNNFEKITINIKIFSQILQRLLPSRLSVFECETNSHLMKRPEREVGPTLPT